MLKDIMILIMYNVFKLFCCIMLVLSFCLSQYSATRLLTHFNLPFADFLECYST